MVDDCTARNDGTAIGGDPDPSAALDAAFDLLSVERRRRALYRLRDRDDPMSLSDLADALVAEESAPAADPAERRERVAVSLGQVHLPKLADADVVDYSRSERRVEYEGDAFVEPFLDRAAELER
ncbi:DUF7344 domain-containing protein [Halostella litorea]|uniref:DUF7344 domain-containing protein n=1 Tax=Halostella litorea TaxID=2528831 RepID=UPI0010922E63|nr:hypothetical protein [Halostella litorea]